MDLIIFLQAMGNVAFAAILFLALSVTALYYAAFVLLKGIKRTSLHTAKNLLGKVRFSGNQFLSQQKL